MVQDIQLAVSVEDMAPEEEGLVNYLNILFLNPF